MKLIFNEDNVLHPFEGTICNLTLSEDGYGWGIDTGKFIDKEWFLNADELQQITKEVKRRNSDFFKEKRRN